MLARLPGMAGKTGRSGRRGAPVVLTDEERAALRYALGRTVSQALAFRARIILGCAEEGKTSGEVADELGTSPQTVSKWRQRFARTRIAGLAETPRPNVDRRFGDDRVEEVIRATLESTPKGATHWSTRKMAKALGVSQSSVSRTWRAFGLKPHRSRTFTLSTDDFFVEKVRDIVGLYMNPPDNALVVCVDEKTQIQALERTQPMLPMVFGQAQRGTHTYRRHGTTNLFAALVTATGEVIGQCFPRKRAREFRNFLDKVEANVPPDFDVHVVVDNSSIHTAPTVQRWLKQNPRFHMHFTPTYSSWLNLVERWFAKLTEETLRRSSHRNTTELQEAIYGHIDATNEEPKPFIWTKTADQIIASVARFCARTLAQRNS
jgi:transposase